MHTQALTHTQLDCNNKVLLLLTKMNCSCAAVHSFRSVRKCFSISGILVLTLFLFAAQVSCRPSEELLQAADLHDEYADVDNIEWHHVKIVDGVMHEDHPVIMYKEDFVSEDYDPNKNRTHSAKSQRKYKEISHRRHRLNRTNTEQYRALKPEKMYFDVLPQMPVVVTDDSAANDSKFDASKIRVELIPLTDDEMTQKNVQTDDDEDNKELLNKRPKKYHKRIRRNVGIEELAEFVRNKRNPYYRTQSDANNFAELLKYFQENARGQAPLEPKRQPAVQGKFWNSINSRLNLPEVTQSPKSPVVAPQGEVDNRFGGPDNTDIVRWDKSDSPTRKPASQARLPAALSLFHDSNPEKADLSFLTRRPPTTPKSIGPRTAFEKKPTIEEQVSKCVWAVVNCCSSRDIDIRYNCFEELNCTGAFWDLNPCSDGVKDNLVNYVSEVYN